MKDNMLSTQDALKYLRKEYGIRVTDITMQAWARKGLLGHKVGSRWFFSEDELDKFVKPGKR